MREWRGVTHTVLIHADGIEWRGQRYRSLSLVARKITGARWSGPRFLASGSGRWTLLQPREQAMARADPARAGLTVRCAIYTRKSSDEGLEQEFNSLDAQRKACEAYIESQRHAGWPIPASEETTNTQRFEADSGFEPQHALYMHRF